MSVTVAGTIALDSIETPASSRTDLLGGSAAYAALAASFSSPVHLCSIVGTDFPKQHLDLFHAKGIATDSVQIEDGKTFRWSGRYFDDMNQRETLSVSIDVLEKFQPKLSPAASQTTVVLLANMSPENQLSVLSQSSPQAFVIADSMDLWINIAKEKLLEVLSKCDLFVINEGEAKQLTGTSNLITAGHRMLALGPKHVVIKKGEHGAMLFGEGHFFTTTAFPLHEVADPTGAGDTFAGGIAGYLSSLNQPKSTITFADLSSAVVSGTVLASFTCEAFSTDSLVNLTQPEIDARRQLFRSYTAF